MAIVLEQLQAPKMGAAVVSAGGSLDASTTYYYRVIACNNANLRLANRESPRSNVVSAVTTVTDKTVTLQWNVPPSASYFCVLRSTTQADLEGDETVPQFVSVAWLYPTTYTSPGATGYADDGTVWPGDNGAKFWYRPHGCPTIRSEFGTFGSGAPGTLSDLYDADQAGTLELMPDEAATADSPHSLRTPVNPADDLQLTLDLVVSGYVGAGSVTINGRNVVGEVVTEVVAVNGNGTFTTTKTYAAVDVDGLVSTGTYDFQVVQNRWGYVFPRKSNENSVDAIEDYSVQWQIRCNFLNESWFAEVYKQVQVLGRWQPNVLDDVDCVWQVGVEDADGGLSCGVDWTWAGPYNKFDATGRRYSSFSSKIWPTGDQSSSGGVTAFAPTWSTRTGFFADGVDMVGSIVQLPEVNYAVSYVYDGSVYEDAILRQAVRTAEAMDIDFAGSSLRTGYLSPVAGDTIVRNLNLYGGIAVYMFPFMGIQSLTLVDCTFHLATVQTDEPQMTIHSAGSATTFLNLSYTHTVRVLDEDGVPLSGVTVTCTGADDSVVYSEITDVYGEITPQAASWGQYVITPGLQVTRKYALDNISGLSPTSANIVPTYQVPYTFSFALAGYSAPDMESVMETGPLNLITVMEADSAQPVDAKIVRLDSSFT